MFCFSQHPSVDAEGEVSPEEMLVTAPPVSTCSRLRIYLILLWSLLIVSSISSPSRNPTKIVIHVFRVCYQRYERLTSFVYFESHYLHVKTLVLALGETTLDPSPGLHTPHEYAISYVPPKLSSPVPRFSAYTSIPHKENVPFAFDHPSLDLFSHLQ